MMFSMPLLLPPESRLSHHLPLLQHIIAVAVVHGIRSQEGYQDLPLRIKWPNDIYYESQVKLGGILVSCLSLGNSTNTAVIGEPGLQVSQFKPPVCDHFPSTGLPILELTLPPIPPCLHSAPPSPPSLP